MIEASTRREWMFHQMAQTIPTLEYYVASITSVEATTYRDGGTGWTVTETLCHLRDFEDMFIQRATATVEKDNPPLNNRVPDELAAEKGYASERDPKAVFVAWRALREHHMTYLKSLDETAWSRTGQHPSRGAMTLEEQLALTARHDADHIGQIAKIMLGKQTH